MKLVKCKKGKIYLDSVRKVTPIPNTETYNVARGKMKGIVQLLPFAPSWQLVMVAKDYGVKNIWDKYTKLYKMELEENPEVLELVSYLKSTLDKGINIEFLCFCGSSAYCHRRLLAEFYFKDYEIITLH